MDNVITKPKPAVPVRDVKPSTVSLKEFLAAPEGRGLVVLIMEQGAAPEYLLIDWNKIRPRWTQTATRDDVWGPKEKAFRYVYGDAIIFVADMNEEMTRRTETYSFYVEKIND